MSPDTLQVAVVGAGYWGPNLIRTFDGLAECQVRWVCDKKPGRLRYVQEQFPHLPVTGDLGQVLADPAVGAVAIATPVSTHRAVALAALAAGKHVLVEKPLADSVTNARAIVAAAQAAERVLAVGHVFVHHPAVVRMRELIDAGKIGRLCYCESSRVNLGPPASEVNVIWDLAVHDLAMLLYLWDEMPVELTAYGNRFLHPRFIDAAFLHVRFAGGGIAQHHVSWLSPEKVRRFFVAGTQGSLHFDDTLAEGKLRHIDQGEDNRIGLGDEESKPLHYRPGQVHVPTLPAQLPLGAECADFIRRIREGGRPVADGRAGLSVVRLLELADESIARGSVPISLDWTD